ncbi:MAG: hypothetical protein LUE26_03400 [Alistipes sp.]|nr:hypothetical protein [Alistipes sp.]
MPGTFPFEYLTNFPNGDLPYETDRSKPWTETVYFLDYDAAEIIQIESFTLDSSEARRLPMVYRWLDDLLTGRQ